MFVDSAVIQVRAGKGGNGCISFRREKYIQKGGPDGGDGGDGGHVFVRAVAGIDTLLDFSGKHHWSAQNGQPGSGSNCTGKTGDDLVIDLPPGTIVYDRETGVPLIDLKSPGDQACVALGGKGGRGNRKFATPTHRTPREAEEGTPGQERFLRLELKLIADVGIVGLPNAGKSTLLSRLSRAHPKIADYPFTTLAPQLGIVELTGHRRLVMADIPGLIEGAHQGAGLGDAFLRHIERTSVILHLVDVGTPDPPVSPEQAYRLIRHELEQYSAQLAAKRELIVANKTDLTGSEAAAAELGEALGLEVLSISAATGANVAALKERMWMMIHDAARDRQSTECGHPVESNPAPEAPAPSPARE